MEYQQTHQIVVSIFFNQPSKVENDGGGNSADNSKHLVS